MAAQLEAENEVNNEMANRMSLFYAEATPMLKTLSNATTKFVSEVEVVCPQIKLAPTHWFLVRSHLITSETPAEFTGSGGHAQHRQTLQM